jgi:hypothetical protein
MSNWFKHIDFSSPNWSSQTQRELKHYKPVEDKIPLVAYLGAAIFICVLVGMMFIGSAVGF